MTNRETILKTIKFIESNLTSDINVLDIANEGFYSLYHFIRLFQNIVGISPKKYLLQRRLTEAVKQLRNTDEKIVNIAFYFQFGSHEVFTRTFRKYFGTTPSNIRKGEVIPTHLLTKPITENYLYHSKKARNQPPDLIELKEKILVGVSYFISNRNKTKDLTKEWNNFLKEVKTVKNKIIPECYYQVQFWSDNQDLEGMNFFIGVEADTIEKTSPQFLIKIIPKGTYLRFLHKGQSRNVGYTYRYVYNEFLPDTNYKLTMPFNFEFYGEKYLSANDEQSESYIFIPIKK